MTDEQFLQQLDEFACELASIARHLRDAVDAERARQEQAALEQDSAAELAQFLYGTEHLP